MWPKPHSKKILLVLVSLALAGGGWAWWNSKGSAAPVAKAPMPVPVTVAQAQSGSLPVLLNVVGRAEAYESVSLKSRVDGQVLATDYREGQHVRAGDVLVRLDPADFVARLRQAEANLARDQATQTKLQADVARYVSLKARGFVSDEKVNEVSTNEVAASAAVRADQAAVDLARLQVSYTTLRAPFAGVVGARLVFPGSAVKTNDTVLAVVNRVRPLYVTFSVPEKHLERLRQAMQGGPLTVLVNVPGGAGASYEGSARFIDNAVDAATGTIQMKAVLDNADEALTPGQFLNVSLTLQTLQDVPLIPAEAVQQGAEGNYLYAVKADNTVESRKIEVLTAFKGQAAIGKGVAAGETVVVDGQLRLTPGATIKVKEPTPAKAAEAAVPASPAQAAAPAR